MNLFVTGCSGFIGTNFIYYLRKHRPDWHIVNLDKLTYAGNRTSLVAEETSGFYTLCQGDICCQADIEKAASYLPGPADAILNFAAESHVDNSISNPGVFIETNVKGTLNLLNYARAIQCRYLQVSTDEVYGSLGATGLFTEQSPIAPNSPYSASKAAADLLVRAWHETFKLDTITTRCSNNYGPYQYPEKLIPLAITHLLNQKKIPVYGQGLNIRDWIHVDDHCSGILLALEKGRSGEVYNIGGNNEWKNLDIAHLLLDILKMDKAMIHFVTDRPGHDLRYAIDASKIRAELNWQPQYSFEKGLPETVQWYLANESWWKPLLQTKELTQ
jgi:dTDP-glucose 4,6-dehydratase